MTASDLYDRHPHFVLGFHGCSREVAEHALAASYNVLRESENDYDWQGRGVYAWESSLERARGWADQKQAWEAKAGRSFEPAVIGLVIDLGNCLNLIDQRFIELLPEAYEVLQASRGEQKLPENHGGDDRRWRRLDCAVINLLADRYAEAGEPFDTVRGLFAEGPPTYPDTGFHSQSHIQIAVRNPACIRAVFRPCNYTTEYRFDLSSNRTQLLRDAGSDGLIDETVDYVYDANDRLQSETSSLDGVTTYAYDRTLQIGKTDADGTVATQTYDVMGRLRTVTIDATASGGAVTEESYTYDTDGIRTSRTVNGETTVFLYDTFNSTGFAQILEQGVDASGDGELQADEVEHAFTIGLDVITQAEVGQVLHLLYDQHGSTRALTDAAGNIASVNGVSQSFTYDAYGQAVGFDVSAAATDLLYSGEFTNANTGGQYLRARYYDVSNGRFNRLDPFVGSSTDPLSFNKYQYTHGNPISGIDPSGETLISLAAQSLRFRLLRVLPKVITRLQKSAPVIGRAVSVAAKSVVWLNISAGFESDNFRTKQAVFRSISYNNRLVKQFSSQVSIATSKGSPAAGAFLANKFKRVSDDIARAGLPAIRNIGGSPVQIERKSNGLPDFSPYILRRGDAVSITLNPTREMDKFEANLEAGISTTVKTGFVWHHHEVVGVMELIPFRVNQSVGHNGGRLMFELLSNI